MEGLPGIEEMVDGSVLVIYGRGKKWRFTIYSREGDPVVTSDVFDNVFDAALNGKEKKWEWDNREGGRCGVRDGAL